MYEYGNARIAARRARLLGPDLLARLAAAESPDAMLLVLERMDDWRAILRDLGQLVSPPRSGVELAIERQRSGCLADLATLFPPPARSLVEALALPLDLERLLEVLRRRRAGEPAESVQASVSRGAVLDDGAIGAVARAADPRAVVRVLARAGVLTRDESAALAGRWKGGVDPVRLEADLAQAIDVARRRRADEPGTGAARTLVLAILDAERADAREIAEELRSNGPEAASDLERQRRLARLDRLAAAGRRDPLGIGVAIGYLAAVEAQSIRLRAALAAAAGGWSRERAGAWLEPGGRAA